MEFTMQRRDRLLLVLVLVALAASGVLTWQIHRELRALQVAHEQLSADVAALRGLQTIDVSGAPALGKEDAVVTLVEFSDYECPFCIRHFRETMPRIAEAIDAGRVRYVFKDFPIASLHPGAARAHEAARCADEQGKFWQLHARLFAPAGSHEDAQLEALAAEAGLEVNRFRDCLTSGRHTEAVKASVAQALSLQANGTPAFFLGIRDPATNRVEVLHAINGAQPFDVFEEAIAAVSARVVD
jgi:protein-disulfide isomerase